MPPHGDQRRAAPTPSNPDVVGDHLVIDKREWVPGPHPEPHRRHGEEWYLETYFRCVRCGEQRLRKDGFPGACAAVDRD